MSVWESIDELLDDNEPTRTTANCASAGAYFSSQSANEDELDQNELLGIIDDDVCDFDEPSQTDTNTRSNSDQQARSRANSAATATVADLTQLTAGEHFTSNTSATTAPSNSNSATRDTSIRATGISGEAPSLETNRRTNSNSQLIQERRAHNTDTAGAFCISPDEHNSTRHSEIVGGSVNINSTNSHAISAGDDELNYEEDDFELAESRHSGASSATPHHQSSMSRPGLIEDTQSTGGSREVARTSETTPCNVIDTSNSNMSVDRMQVISVSSNKTSDIVDCQLRPSNASPVDHSLSKADGPTSDVATTNSESEGGSGGGCNRPIRTSSDEQLTGSDVDQQSTTRRPRAADAAKSSRVRRARKSTTGSGDDDDDDGTNNDDDDEDDEDDDDDDENRPRRGRSNYWSERNSDEKLKASTRESTTSNRDSQSSFQRGGYRPLGGANNNSNNNNNNNANRLSQQSRNGSNYSQQRNQHVSNHQYAQQQQLGSSHQVQTGRYNNNNNNNNISNMINSGQYHGNSRNNGKSCSFGGVGGVGTNNNHNNNVNNINNSNNSNNNNSIGNGLLPLPFMPPNATPPTPIPASSYLAGVHSGSGAHSALGGPSMSAAVSLAMANLASSSVGNINTNTNTAHQLKQAIINNSHNIHNVSSISISSSSSHNVPPMSSVGGNSQPSAAQLSNLSNSRPPPAMHHQFGAQIQPADSPYFSNLAGGISAGLQAHDQQASHLQSLQQQQATSLMPANNFNSMNNSNSNTGLFPSQAGNVAFNAPVQGQAFAGGSNSSSNNNNNNNTSFNQFMALIRPQGATSSASGPLARDIPPQFAQGQILHQQLTPLQYQQKPQQHHQLQHQLQQHQQQQQQHQLQQLSMNQSMMSQSVMQPVIANNGHALVPLNNQSLAPPPPHFEQFQQPALNGLHHMQQQHQQQQKQQQQQQQQNQQQQMHPAHQIGSLYPGQQQIHTQQHQMAVQGGPPPPLHPSHISQMNSSQHSLNGGSFSINQHHQHPQLQHQQKQTDVPMFSSASMSGNNSNLHHPLSSNEHMNISTPQALMHSGNAMSTNNQNGMLAFPLHHPNQPPPSMSSGHQTQPGGPMPPAAGSQLPLGVNSLQQHQQAARAGVHPHLNYHHQQQQQQQHQETNQQQSSQQQHLLQPQPQQQAVQTNKPSTIFINPSFLAKQQQQQQQQQLLTASSSNNNSNGGEKNNSQESKSSHQANEQAAPKKAQRSRKDLDLLLEKRLAAELMSDAAADAHENSSSLPSASTKTLNHSSGSSSSNTKPSSSHSTSSSSSSSNKRKSTESRISNGTSLSSSSSSHSASHNSSSNSSNSTAKSSNEPLSTARKVALSSDKIDKSDQPPPKKLMSKVNVIAAHALSSSSASASIKRKSSPPPPSIVTVAAATPATTTTTTTSTKVIKSAAESKNATIKSSSPSAQPLETGAASASSSAMMIDDPEYIRKLEEQKKRREEMLRLKEEKRNQRVLEMKSVNATPVATSNEAGAMSPRERGDNSNSSKGGKQHSHSPHRSQNIRNVIASSSMSPPPVSSSSSSTSTSSSSLSQSGKPVSRIITTTNSFVKLSQAAISSSSSTSSRRLVIQNLSLNTSEKNLSSMCNSLNLRDKVLRIEMYKNEAEIFFSDRESADKFLKKYNRTLVDLSIISMKIA